jgi:hypothetical protein
VRRLRLTDAALLAVALALVVATTVSVARGIAFRRRLPADHRAFATWVAHSGGRYGTAVAQPVGNGDVLCAAALGARYRQCVIVTHAGRVAGGFRTAPGIRVRGVRGWRCFGAARRDAACAPEAAPAQRPRPAHTSRASGSRSSLPAPSLRRATLKPWAA